MPYTLPALPYEYAALEPFIDAQTMEIHHSKHHQAYVNNLNKAIAGTTAANLPLEALLQQISYYPDAVRNNAGGHYNHSLFWQILTPEKNTTPTKSLEDAINKQFGSIDSLKILLNKAAVSQFGSGWAWLCVDTKNNLFVSATANQDNPLMDIVEKKGTPLLGIDVWEHAYYLKYQNKRGDYLSAIWNVINWPEVSKRYDEYVMSNQFVEWQALHEFSSVFTPLFQQSEQNNLAPIKAKSHNLVEKSSDLAKSVIPNPYKTQKIKLAVKKLVAESKKLHQLIEKKEDDQTIKKALNSLQATFKTIIN
ncbi:MAG: superoxide dismutase [Chitinophagales bacterium]|nr:superoxide dismutase [Chitinophagales bacterium]MCC7057765.1 superoxide dismutase [Chitinophagales bacterium]